MHAINRPNTGVKLKDLDDGCVARGRYVVSVQVTSEPPSAGSGQHDRLSVTEAVLLYKCRQRGVNQALATPVDRLSCRHSSFAIDSRHRHRVVAVRCK